MINRLVKKTSPLCIAIILTSCTSVPKNNDIKKNELTVNSSYLSGKDNDFNGSDPAGEKRGDEKRDELGLQKISSIERNNVIFQSSQLAKKFSDSQMVNVTANEMAIKDFIHYVYGELLSVNYLLTPNVSSVKQKVTLNLKENVSQRRLYALAESVLADRGLKLKFDDEVYLISNVAENSKSATVVGMGRDLSSIPSSNRRIMQVVPVLYGIKTTLKHTIEQLADVSITIDVKQSTLFVTGDYANVSRALELVSLLDSPANRGRHVGLVKLTYSSSELYLQQLSVLLENEGIPNSINTPGNNNLVFVPLPQIGSVVVFSATEILFNRVQFWTRKLDKPSEGDVKQYFVFHPQYARAQDIGESLTPLISARSNAVSAKVTALAATNKSDSKGNTSGQLTNAKRKSGGSNDQLTFVVDERSNALIFYTTGTEYRNIIPLINRLDVLPKQVMLDIVVAEVTLTDEFKFGVKWALENGRFSGGTIGDVSAASGGFSFLFGNGRGESVQAAFSQSDTNVNILSNPNILVRDGVTATLDIGTDIAITDSVTRGFDSNDRETTSTSYRKTGIRLTVTPTINAKGVVIMDIEESISNEAKSGAGATGNPNIFERNISTAVVAESGQTIILGGLIEERKTIVDNKIPLLGDIPLLGNIFKSQDDSITKTELVLMVTPKVINRTDQWKDIMSSFQSNLINLKVEN